MLASLQAAYARFAPYVGLIRFILAHTAGVMGLAGAAVLYRQGHGEAAFAALTAGMAALGWVAQPTAQKKVTG